MNRPGMARPSHFNRRLVVSPFEVYGSELIISSNAILPPVCVETGEVMDLQTAEYLPVYLKVEEPGMGKNAYVNSQTLKGSALVRLALSRRGLRKRRTRKVFGIVLAPLLLIGFIALIHLSTLKHILVPGILSAVIFLGLFTLLCLGLGSVFYCFNPYRARTVGGGKIAFGWIPPLVLKRMLEWQHNNQQFYR